MPDSTSINVNTDGIQFKRTGTCSQCGACCGKCPHLEEKDGKFICNIYDKRDQICTTCEKGNGYVDEDGTHKHCVSDFPLTPFVKCVKNGKCAFKFTVKNPKDQAKFNELNSRWQVD